MSDPIFVEYMNLAPSGISETENGELIPSNPFLGKCGEIIGSEDSAADSENPTGYEPIYHLVDFGDNVITGLPASKLWIPERTFCGIKDDREVWSNHLTRTVPKSFLKEKLLFVIQQYGNSCVEEGTLTECENWGKLKTAEKERASKFEKIQKILSMI